MDDDKTHDELVEECFLFLKENKMWKQHLKVTKLRPVNLIRPIVEYDQSVVKEATALLNDWLIAMWRPMTSPNAIEAAKKQTIGKWSRTRWEQDKCYRSRDPERWRRQRRNQARRKRERELNKILEDGHNNFKRLADLGVIE